MKSASAEKCAAALKEANRGVHAALSEALSTRARGALAPLYGMLSYFMGFSDERFRPSDQGGGKRFRPGLCLLLAEAYGVREEAFNAALAIELFHNFTLIHDDVEDHDEYRRNRPTVWKLWGVNHAINAGDVQSLLAAELSLRAGPSLGAALIEAFIEVWEGQYLDLQFADEPLGGAIATEALYMDMVRGKTAALVRVAVEVPGLAARVEAAELERLREYGTSLGIAFQIADDSASVWSGREETGKDTLSDVRERKRTLPVLYAYAHSAGRAKSRLAQLYALPRPLTSEEALEARAIFDSTDARSYVQERIKEHAARARESCGRLQLPADTRETLADLVDMLVFEPY